MNTIISLPSFINTSVGQIYRLAPNYNPRNIGIITTKIIEEFKKDAQTISNNFFYYSVDVNEVHKFTENILMQIDEFRELNVSQNEYVRGIKVDDPNRSSIQFVSAYDVPPSYDDFVDLDACIRNIANIIVNDAFTDYLLSELGDDTVETYLKRFYEGKEG